MATLEESIRMKNASVKGPSLSGQARLKTPDTPLHQGDSGGIAKSKSVKNAGSTSTGNPKSPASDFIKRTFGIDPKKNSTNEYM